MEALIPPHPHQHWLWSDIQISLDWCPRDDKGWQTPSDRRSGFGLQGRHHAWQFSAFPGTPAWLRDRDKPPDSHCVLGPISRSCQILLMFTIPRYLTPFLPFFPWTSIHTSRLLASETPFCAGKPGVALTFPDWHTKDIVKDPPQDKPARWGLPLWPTPPWPPCHLHIL